MTSTALPQPSGFRRILSWPRLRFTLGVSALFGVMLGLHVGSFAMVVRALLVGVAILVAFGVFERWPRRPPRWLGRAALQLIGIVIAIPIAASFAYLLTTGPQPQSVGQKGGDRGRSALIFTSLLFAPWIAVGAMLRQRDAFARDQAFAFELERSEFENKALEARLRLLQAQVEPHFLFNTLANVQALVDSGSPQASKVLTSLIAYLRAAVPRMHATATTLDEELGLVRAYLELMQMRMPDRLQFALHIDPTARRMQCPPMTLLTLVENAVRHGIDPSEIGGRIAVDVWLRDGRCLVRVTDTGVGMKAKSSGLGTGLSTLRERMRLAFNGDAQLRITEIEPHGVCAEIEFPARPEQAAPK